MSNTYSHDERYKIIRYILDNKILGGLKGNAIWKAMEKANIIDRSWQSMKSQFRDKIINILHLFNLTEDERKQILHGYGTKMKTRTDEFQGTVVGNRKRLLIDSDSDGDTTLHLTEENNTLEKRSKSDSESSTSPEEGTKSDSNTKTSPEVGSKSDSKTKTLPEETKSDSESSTSPVEGSKSDSECSTSPEEGSKSDSESLTSPEEESKSNSESSTSFDLLFPVKTSLNKHVNDNTCTTNTNECSIEEPKSQEHQTDSSVVQIDDECNNEFNEDANSVQGNSFSLEEDTKLILFFKSHACEIHDEITYKAFQMNTSSARSCETLKDRFVNHIVPNLFNYNCLTYDEMIVLYDRWGLDVPEEIQLRIRQVIAKRTSTKKVGTDTITVDVATQATEAAYENAQPKLYRAGKYIGWSDNGATHIFIPNTYKDHNEKRRKIHDEFSIADENIHFVSTQSYTAMNDLINYDAEFKSLCDEFLETGEFNFTHVVPVLDKMTQVDMDLTDNDLDETVMQSEEET